MSKVEGKEEMEMKFEDEKLKFAEYAEAFENSAYPTTLDLKYESKPNSGFKSMSKGLSKRELFALENHAQLIRFVIRDQMTHQSAAELAIAHADALLAALGKGE